MTQDSSRPPRPGLCGRPTAHGEPCRQPVFSGPACHSHLTSDERAERERTWSLSPQRQGTPACWRWSVGDEDQAVARSAGEGWATVVLRHWQNDVCAVCGWGASNGLVVDHDHETGLIRGMLCGSCNISEGSSDDLIFRRYRERNPASMLGLVARYWSPFAGLAEPVPVVSERAKKAAAGKLHIPYRRPRSPDAA